MPDLGVRTAALLVIAGLVLTIGGCSNAEPVRDARETLGTVVSITAYPAQDVTEEQMADALDAAYAALGEVEAALDAHDPESPIARVNAEAGTTLLSGTSAWLPLPNEAFEAIAAAERLDVQGVFSVYLYDIIAAYDFEGEGRVPSDDEMRLLLPAAAAALWETDPRLGIRRNVAGIRGVHGSIHAGLDFGGASKGLALQRAADSLRESGAIEAVLLTAGSTTITWGEKPDGESWKVGIEDPRHPDAVIATVEASGPVDVSTSGDYQRYFERHGVRYHHIIDPRTGKPARGLRSLTVVGALSGLDSDILSTALFVAGVDEATSYAERNGLGLFMVDDEGRTHIVPGPDPDLFTISLAEASAD